MLNRARGLSPCHHGLTPELANALRRPWAVVTPAGRSSSSATGYARRALIPPAARVCSARAPLLPFGRSHRHSCAQEATTPSPKEFVTLRETQAAGLNVRRDRWMLLAGRRKGRGVRPSGESESHRHSSSNLTQSLLREARKSIVSRVTQFMLVFVTALTVFPGMAFGAAELTCAVNSVTSPATSAGAITIGYSVTNAGPDTAVANGIRFYVSSDQAYQSTDTQLGATQSVPSLCKGCAVSSATVSRTLPTLTAGGWYIIARVDPLNVVVETSDSNNTSTARAFTVSPLPCPGAFNNSSPANNAVLTSGTTNATLSWTSSSHAVEYYVYFPTSSSAWTTTTSTSVSVTVQEGGNYSWKVIASNSCGNANSSSGPWSFSVASCPTIGTFSNIAPSNQYAVDPPAASIYLLWGKSSGATSYELFFENSSSPSLLATVQSASCGTSDCRYQVSLAYNKSYWWRVVAKSACRSLTSSSGTWSFTNPPQPTKDLYASPKVTPAEVYPGDAVTITTTTTNQGTVGAGATSTKLWLSTNQTVDAADVEIAAYSVPALVTTTNHIDVRSFAIPTSTAAGSWYVIARADVNNVVPDESNEGNNEGAYPFSVASRPGLPDLAVSPIAVTPTGSITDKTLVTVASRVTNSGGQDSGSFAWRMTMNGRVVKSGGNSLAPSGYLSENIVSWTGTLQTGAYEFTVTADSGASVTESFEDNNVQSRTVTSGVGSYGATVITHGYQGIVGNALCAPSWTNKLALAIRARLEGRGQILLYSKSSGRFEAVGGLGGDCSEVFSPVSQDATGERILIFDWAKESNDNTEGYSEAAAEALVAALLASEQRGEIDLSELHFIGHSRGAVVNSEAIERLLSLGKTIRQITTLDPHDYGGPIPDTTFELTDDFDVNRNKPYPLVAGLVNTRRGVLCWAGAHYCDNYYQVGRGTLDGISIPGAANVNLSEKSYMDHSDLHSWFHFSADTAASAIDGETSLSGNNGYVRNDWFNADASRSAREASVNAAICASERTAVFHRSTEGYFFADRAGGSRFRCEASNAFRTTEDFDWATEGVVNGNFGRGGGSDLPGWEYHHPPLSEPHLGAILSVGGNRVLQLAGRILPAGPARRHNRFFVPHDAAAVSFRYAVSSPDPAAALTVTVGAVTHAFSIGSRTCDVFVSKCDFTNVLIPASAVRGSVVEDLTFSVPSGSVAEVYVDDVTIVLSGLAAPGTLSAENSGSGVKLTWSDLSSSERGFSIERRVPNGAWTQVATTAKDSLTHTDTGVSGCSAYEYRMYAYDGGARSGYSNAVSITSSGCTSKPDAPARPAATPLSPSTVRVTWSDMSSNETGFVVESRPASSSVWAVAGQVEANVIALDVAGLEPCAIYAFRVYAYAVEASAPSAEAGAATQGCSSQPARPTNISASASSSTSIAVSWSPASANESGFVVERRLSSSTTWTEAGRIGPGATTLQVSSLVACTTYALRVVAFNSAGLVASDEASATTLGCSTIPDSPTALVATALGGGGVDLRWNDNSTSESGFRIQRRVASASEWGVAGTVAANEKQFVDETPPCTTLLYRVVAYSAAGESAPSNMTSITSDGCPETGVLASPTGVIATFGVGGVTVTWNAVAGAAHYEVHRSSQGGAFAVIASPSSPEHIDGGVAASTTYVYKVRAVDAANTGSLLSDSDIATTILFTDSSLGARSSVIRAVHFTELRVAVNAVRAAAGLTAFIFTDTTLKGMTVRAVHIQELQSVLSDARALVGVPSRVAGSVTAGGLIRAADITALRDGVM